VEVSRIIFPDSTRLDSEKLEARTQKKKRAKAGRKEEASETNLIFYEPSS
jgi:hypothetical protein